MPATTVRELPADVVVRSHRRNRETVSSGAVAVEIGFYALMGQSVITYKKELVKETIVEALEETREQNPRGRILLVADNYGSHHARLTHELADELGIEFVFIPPYSPTLNAITTVERPQARDFTDYLRGQ